MLLYKGFITKVKISSANPGTELNEILLVRKSSRTDAASASREMAVHKTLALTGSKKPAETLSANRLGDWADPSPCQNCIPTFLSGSTASHTLLSYRRLQLAGANEYSTMRIHVLTVLTL